MLALTLQKAHGPPPAPQGQALDAQLSSPAAAKQASLRARKSWLVLPRQAAPLTRLLELATPPLIDSVPKSLPGCSSGAPRAPEGRWSGLRQRWPL